VSQGLNILFFSVTIFMTVRYFIDAFQREHARAERLVVDLTETNAELDATLTELRETQTELVRSEKMAALGKLAAGVAHEINNPIGALKSTASTSARCISKIERLFEEKEKFAEIREDGDFQNYLRILKDNGKVFTTAGDRVAHTVNSFIQFARLDKAGFDKVDIHAGIDHTLELIRHELKARTRVVKEYGEVPQIACFPSELNQVFMNLLINAAQAIEDQGTISIRTFVEDEKVYIQIRDTGSGIPPEQIEGLFDPSFTRNGARVRAGLGLFSSYQAVKRHRGRIEVDSVMGEGSTFTIILPMDLDGETHE
jgi:signal transduction histidine kinase